MEGYIFGVLWTILKTYSRWFEEEVRTSEKPAIEPVDVKEVEPSDESQICIFEVQLKKEELKEVFDLFFKGKQYFKEGSFDQSVKYLRGALEHGFKLKIGLNSKDQTSLTYLIRAYKDMDIELPYRQIKDAWDALSRMEHLALHLTPEEIKKLIVNIGAALRGLEITSNIQKDQLIERIREIKTSD